MEAYSALAQNLRRRCPELELREYEAMRQHTSFRIGGPVRLMALPRSEEEAVEAVRSASELGLVPFFMGNGSNLLVSDQGWEGFVIKTCGGLCGMERNGEEITAGSGVLLSQLAHFAMGQGLTGLEFAHGIPGSLGGAVTMDAGAYGGEMRQVVRSTVYLNAGGSQGTLHGEEHCFGYRNSAFADGSRLILRTTVALQRGESSAIQAQMDELSARRRSKQPLDLPSAGSTFKRPKGHFAAALIEDCGLKGASAGGAQVSEKHAGFVVNRGGATCDDVLTLIARIQETVFQRTGVRLEMEVKMLGISCAP